VSKLLKLLMLLRIDVAMELAVPLRRTARGKWPILQLTKKAIRDTKK